MGDWTKFDRKTRFREASDGRSSERYVRLNNAGKRPIGRTTDVGFLGMFRVVCHVRKNERRRNSSSLVLAPTCVSRNLSIETPKQRLLNRIIVVEDLECNFSAKSPCLRGVEREAELFDGDLRL